VQGGRKARIWPEVYDAYGDLCKAHGVMLSDLISLILLFAPFEAPALIRVVLMDNWDFTSVQAGLFIADLASKLLENVETVAEGEDLSELLEKYKETAKGASYAKLRPKKLKPGRRAEESRE